MSTYLQAAAILALIIVMTALFCGYVFFVVTRKTAAGTMAAAIPGTLVVLGLLYAMTLGTLMGY